MSLDIANFKNIFNFFGDLIDQMKEKIRDDPINFCLENDREWALNNFEIMLGHLKKSNVDQLIREYKKNGINDQNRIYSLISEIRAGFMLTCMKFPIKYIPEGNGKTPDIKTKIADKTTYVEVKRISERRFEYENLLNELKKRNLQYDISLYVISKVNSASDVVDSFLSNVPEDIPDEFEKEKRFKYGFYQMRKMKNKKPLYLPTISYQIPQTKKEREVLDDSYISKEEVENGIKSDLDNALSKFNEYAGKSDLCFVFLDDIDVFNYGHSELRDFLYNGKEEGYVVNEKIIPKKYDPIKEVIDAKKQGWNNILKDLGFFPARKDYSSNEGWYFYNTEAKNLNGIFHSFSFDFSFNSVYCFLNPFVIEDRNVPALEKILKYYHN
jgi:hypothetical protein